MKGISITLRGLSKRFGNVWALRPLDLEIRAGEFMAFLGPSGCGKTTTLLLIAGIYRPTTGEIYFGDRRVDLLPPRERDVGMVFQSYALYPHLTVFENIAFPLRLKGMPHSLIQERVASVASLLGITEILSRRPGQISGGQQQRTAIARALVKEPRVLLLDEPLSNLDAQIRLQARSEIRRLHQELGITTILVTHDQAEALAMADRVAVFRDGRLHQVGTAQELYERPADTFVAAFVGHPPMNLLEGAVEDGFFRAGEVVIPVPESWPRGEGVLGVRPEDLKLGEGVPSSARVVEPMGREVLVTAELGAGKVVKILTNPQVRVMPGSAIQVSFPPEKLYLFGQDGRRIAP